MKDAFVLKPRARTLSKLHQSQRNNPCLVGLQAGERKSEWTAGSLLDARYVYTLQTKGRRRAHATRGCSDIKDVATSFALLSLRQNVRSFLAVLLALTRSAVLLGSFMWQTSASDHKHFTYVRSENKMLGNTRLYINIHPKAALTENG